MRLYWYSGNAIFTYLHDTAAALFLSGNDTVPILAWRGANQFRDADARGQ